VEKNKTMPDSEEEDDLFEKGEGEVDEDDDLFEEPEEGQENEEEEEGKEIKVEKKTQENDVDEEGEKQEAPVFDFGRKKRKTKTKGATQEPEEKGSLKNSDGSFGKTSENVVSEADPSTKIGNNFYSYEYLAKRIFNLINSSGEHEKVKVKMKPPVVYREGTKKTIWVNFPEICKIMNRSQDHVLSFLLAEVGTTGSIDGSSRFVIKGRFQPKHIENILRRYIGEYVKCQTCKSPETTLKRENRLLFMVCTNCGSKRTVTPIKTGFQATTRAGRRAART